jgi:transposase-like protein
MAQLLHGSATTTARTRAEVQSPEESVAALARRHGMNLKTVAKWRSRHTADDLPMGPRELCEASRCGARLKWVGRPSNAQEKKLWSRRQDQWILHAACEPF